ncbi:MAG: hypothetical protein V3V06_06185 [Dehalococcoidia bacterium]
MRRGNVARLVVRTLAIGLLAGVMLASALGTALAAADATPEADAPAGHERLAPEPGEEAPAPTQTDEAETHAQDDDGFPAAAWVGLAIAFLFALLLLIGSAAYILPKPPRR